jgi:hypothetical protein
MMPARQDQQQLTSGRSPRREPRWRPVDVTMLVAALCYGGAMLTVAVGLLLRLAH